MQLVLEFGSNEPQPVLRELKRAAGEVQLDAESLPAGANTYIPTTDTVESAELKLARGEISAFLLRPREGLVRYALVLEPHFEGGQLSMYLGTIEYTGRHYAPVWNSLLENPDLAFACVGYEEGVELSDAQLRVETFPWNRWPLVIGALRDSSGSRSWTIREGPAMKSLRNGQPSLPTAD